MRLSKFIISFIATIGYAKLTTHGEPTFLNSYAFNLLENEYYQKRSQFRNLYDQSKEYFAVLKSTSDSKSIINDYPIEKTIDGNTFLTLRQAYFVSVLNNYCLNSFVFNYHIEKIFTELSALQALRKLLCSAKYPCFVKDVNDYILGYGVLKYELIEQNQKFLRPYLLDHGKFGPNELITPVFNILLESIDCHQNCIFSILKIIEDMKNNTKRRDEYMDNLMDLVRNGFFPSKGAYYKLEHQIINYLNGAPSQASFILQEGIKSLRKAREKNINLLDNLMKAHLPVLFKETNFTLCYNHVFPMLPYAVREVKADFALSLISESNRRITGQPLSRYPFLVMKKSIEANLLLLNQIIELTFKTLTLLLYRAFTSQDSYMSKQQELLLNYCNFSFWRFQADEFKLLKTLSASMDNEEDVKAFKTYLLETLERLRQVKGMFHLSTADKGLIMFFNCMYNAFKSISSNIQNSISYFEHYKFNVESYSELKHANPFIKNKKENNETLGRCSYTEGRNGLAWCPNTYINRATSLINSELEKLLENSN